MTAPLISLNNAAVTLRGRAALRDISWRLAPGEHWSVLGANGAGKSTFFRLLRGEQRADQRFDGPPPVFWRLDGEEQTSPIGVRERLPLVSAELQERYTAKEWAVSVHDLILTAFQDSVYLYRPPNDAELARTLDILELARLNDLRDRSVTSLSQGQARRAFVARALAPWPKAILLDEVLEGLDADSRREMLELLDRVAATDVQLLFASHRQDEAPASLNRCLILDHGRVAWSGPLDQAPTDWPRDASPPSIAELWTPVESGVQGETLVEFREVEVFVESKRLLADIDWTLRQGERWALTGPNGAGKSTLVKLLAGDLPVAWGGSVRRFGLPEPAPIEAIRRQVGLVSDELQARLAPGQGYDQNGLELVVSGFPGSIGLHAEPEAWQWDRAQAWIEALGLTELTERSIRAMSHGQVRRLLLARALVHGPRLLLLDEPCSGLDAPSRQAFLGALEALAQASPETTMVYVTHFTEELPQSIDHVLRLEHGRVVSHGPRR